MNDAVGPGPANHPNSHCYRHPGRLAYVRCQRCGQPICAECQVQAPVGVHCRDCVRQAVRQMPVARSFLGAPISAGPPVVTLTMIGLCVIMFIAQKASRDAVTLDLLLIPGVTWYQPWRMVTAAFLHAGIFHLLLNMYALWVVGSFMEQVLGRARMVALYLGSALGGHMLVLIYYRLSDSSWGGFTLGASGAVFGLFAAILVGGRRQRANIRGIVAVIGLNLVLSFTVPGISWQGHVGGLLVGAAMAWAYFYAPPAKRRLWAWLAPIGVVALTVLVMILTVSPLTW